MYCIRCGVKLADTEKECPLCGTAVFHPELKQEEGELEYPQGKYPSKEVNRMGVPTLATAMMLLPVIIVLLCDLRFTHTITWSGYVVGAILLVYEMFILPLWFGKRNPVIFVPCSFVAIGLYLLYINFATGGEWFLSFALPLLGGIALIVSTTTVLLRYVKKGKLFIFGGAFLSIGALMPLLEFLLSITFGTTVAAGWSFYPLMGQMLLGGLLIFLGICRPAREVLERKFFI